MELNMKKYEKSFGGLLTILQGINALLLKGNFVKDMNYYEDFFEHYKWW